MRSEDILKIKGVSLVDEGSADSGLSVGDAIDLIRAIQSEGRGVSGLEVWKKVGARHKIDALMTWYPVSFGFNDSCTEAIDYLRGIGVGAQDLVTVQMQ